MQAVNPSLMEDSHAHSSALHCTGGWLVHFSAVSRQGRKHKVTRQWCYAMLEACHVTHVTFVAHIIKLCFANRVEGGESCSVITPLDSVPPQVHRWGRHRRGIMSHVQA